MYKKVELNEKGFVGMEQEVYKNWQDKNIIEKNLNEEVIQLDWDGKNWNELEDYFKTCWGSRNFRFEPEKGVIIGIKKD